MTLHLDTTDHTTTASSHEARPTSIYPIIPGFHPDPTICRVDGDYYVANSSFEYSPGIPIWHSRDLISWTLIGNALTRDDQFRAGSAPASRGVFAPTLRHHDGRFWLITTDVSDVPGQIVLTAEDPAGPWSAARRIEGLLGIDPDLTWDDDGTSYVTYCSTDPAMPGIAQASVDLETGEVLSGPRSLWSGTGMAFPEAPHLYRRGDWWYLVIAEGGTERGHSVSVARGSRPDGPFEGFRGNPILSHRSSDDPVQNTGHADLVELEDGRWAMVYLAVRPRGVTPLFHVNGRETFVSEVVWADDWPLVTDFRIGSVAAQTGFFDDFTLPMLHPRWVSPGAAPSDIVRRDSDGVALVPAAASNGAVSGLMTRTHGDAWIAEASVDTSRGTGALLVRLDDRHSCELRAEAGRVRVVARVGPLEGELGSLPCGTVTPTLFVESAPGTFDGPDDLVFGIVDAGIRREVARMDGRYLSTEVAGGFTGRVVGAHAIDGAFGLRSFRFTPTA